MGTVFGRIHEETPQYESLGFIGPQQDIEIRRYEPVYVASVSSKDIPGVATNVQFTRMAFGALARYFGVFGKPENKSQLGENGPGEAIPMTSPVVVSTAENLEAEGGEPINMTVPVVMSTSNDSVDMSMSFLLPSKYTAQGTAPPTPLDPKVRIKKLDSRLVAVKKFSGELTKNTAEAAAAEVIGVIDIEGKFQMKRNEHGRPAWEYMGYNAPYTLPWFKTNEVAVLLDDIILTSSSSSADE
ncbi:hypothetical protein H310_09200 [Aphanomyces invadans]|uniref:SOUL heme-binding protein n=1 Tax=Aphanomyces invadans TaxID=157072 RepID=A0A024TUN4_9STRA|nr:hypothetical protein H310_09200 [Aphanomyces invadans]ETV97875.1 hypothetical protein H310_09200 [Aphanomyces invadans]RHY35326.1 hypothetical protein DYB32_000177 [Aphanomyces invadans]|eukprot:XP_008873436.1 hypothetical protein H310_09200 [Aphanomyces invadans]